MNYEIAIAVLFFAVAVLLLIGSYYVAAILCIVALALIFMGPTTRR